jgi:hypothetical protein
LAALYILEGISILIRAIKSQLDLKPYFYSQSAKVGGVGCLLGFIFAYNLFFVIATHFGIESDVPLRSYDNVLVITVFALCVFSLLFSLYVFCVLSGAVYFGIKLKKGHLSKQEFINIVFKGVYPQRWQKGL